MASLVCLEKQPQSALKMLNVQTMCSSIFGGKTTRAYCSLWAGVVGFFLALDHDSRRRCCLWNEVTPTKGVPPLATGFYNAGLLYHEEVGGFWHMYQQGMRSPHLFCYKDFLQNPFIKELVEIERIFTSHVTALRRSTGGSYAGLVSASKWRICLNQPHLTTFPWLRSWIHHWGGGKMAWVAILYPPPPTSGNSFLPHSP